MGLKKNSICKYGGSNRRNQVSPYNKRQENSLVNNVIDKVSKLAEDLLDNGWHERQAKANRDKSKVETTRKRFWGVEITDPKSGGKARIGYQEENSYKKG